MADQKKSPKKKALQTGFRPQDPSEMKLLIQIAETVGELFHEVSTTEPSREVYFSQEICARLWDLHEEWRALPKGRIQ